MCVSISNGVRMNSNMMLLFICTLKRKGLEWNVVLVMMYPLLSYLYHMGWGRKTDRKYKSSLESTQTWSAILRASFKADYLSQCTAVLVNWMSTEKSFLIECFFRKLFFLRFCFGFGSELKDQEMVSKVAISTACIWKTINGIHPVIPCSFCFGRESITHEHHV